MAMKKITIEISSGTGELREAMAAFPSSLTSTYPLPGDLWKQLRYRKKAEIPLKRGEDTFGKAVIRVKG